MKKRLPTAEEKKLWRESNRFTTVKPGIDSEELSKSSDAGSASPLAGEATRLNDPGLDPGEFSRSGEGASTFSAQPHRPLSQPSPTRGEGAASSSLTPLSTREAGKRFKAHSEVEATLDLHGMTKLEAHEKLQQFLRRAARAGKRHVVIITGKGRGGEMGVLRKNLPDWLNAPGLRPLISGFAEAKPEKGGAGVTHVLLKRLR